MNTISDADAELMRLAIGADDDGADDTKKAEGDAKKSGAAEKPGADAAPDPEDNDAAADDADDGADPNVNDEGGDADDADDDGEADGDDEEGERRPKRSKPLERRLAEVTARMRQAERELERLRGEAPKETDGDDAPEKPKPEDFEFGDSDPEYIEALTDWKIETRQAEREKNNSAERERAAVAERIRAGIAHAEAQAKTKYEDFDEKLTEAIAARGGDPIPPALQIAIGLSSVGGDIAYKLATDEATMAKLERLANGGERTAHAFGLALGEIEGEFVEDEDDSDLDPSDPIDTNRMIGRMRARLRGARTKPTSDDKSEPKPVSVTKAPEPAKSRVRGGGGRFDVSDDTDDFAAFEAKIMKGKN